VLVATKGGLRTEGGRLLRDASARWLREGVESSLRNLGTDYIDLYQIHWPDEHTPAEETAGALEDLVREGKIRHVGVSNYDVKQMEEFARFGRLETVQPPYHLFRREIEDEILPYAMDHALGVLRLRGNSPRAAHRNHDTRNDGSLRTTGGPTAPTSPARPSVATSPSSSG